MSMLDQYQYDNNTEQDPLANNKAALLGRVNNAEGNTFGSSVPAIKQSAQDRLIGTLVNPFDNMRNNWNKVSGDFSSGSKADWLTKAGDIYGLAKNPTGDWGSKQQSQATVPTLSNDHYGPANDQGLHPINENGVKYLQANAPSQNVIPDNTSVINIAKPTGIPTVDKAEAPPVTKGFVGRLVGRYLGTGQQQQ